MSNVIPLSPVHRRYAIVLLVVLVPFAIVNLASSPDTRHDETILQNEIAELQLKFEHLRAKYVASQEGIQLLSHQLMQLTESSRILPDLQFFINNGTSNITSIKLPSIYNFLPHLLNDPGSLRPAFVMGKGLAGVSVILGVPTVKREVQSYLLPTLKNLIDSMTSDEITDTLIIVFVAEVKKPFHTFMYSRYRLSPLINLYSL